MKLLPGIEIPESHSAGNVFCPEKQLEKPSASKGQQCCKAAPGPSAGDQDHHWQHSPLTQEQQ